MDFNEPATVKLLGPLKQAIVAVRSPWQALLDSASSFSTSSRLASTAIIDPLSAPQESLIGFGRPAINLIASLKNKMPETQRAVNSPKLCLTVPRLGYHNNPSFCARVLYRKEHRLKLDGVLHWCFLEGLRVDAVKTNRLANNVALVQIAS